MATGKSNVVPKTVTVVSRMDTSRRLRGMRRYTGQLHRAVTPGSYTGQLHRAVTPGSYTGQLHRAVFTTDGWDNSGTNYRDTGGRHIDAVLVQARVGWRLLDGNVSRTTMNPRCYFLSRKRSMPLETVDAISL
ncbi:hypothetical protein Bbelb_341930 [Branchiostoma belcheri]|nr:hypothetical protein Bbelb_341930 [Branchiostoma belcheri]